MWYHQTCAVMAGIDSLVGACPVGARTGRRRPRRSHPPQRSDVPLSQAGDPPRQPCGQRYQRVKRTIASDLDRPHIRGILSCDGPDAVPAHNALGWAAHSPLVLSADTGDSVPLTTTPGLAHVRVSLTSRQTLYSCGAYDRTKCSVSTSTAYSSPAAVRIASIPGPNGSSSCWMS